MNERREKERRISPAVGEFAVQQAPALYAEIDRLRAQLREKEFAGRQSEQSVQAPSGGQPQASASPANLKPVAEFTLENGCLTRTTLHSGLTGEFLVYEKPPYTQQGVVVPETVRTFDAQTWARSFNETLVKLGYQPHDEGWLIGWFANAIMCGYDHASRPAQGAQNAAGQDKPYSPGEIHQPVPAAPQSQEPRGCPTPGACSCAAAQSQDAKDAARYRWLRNRIGATKDRGFYLADWPVTEANLMKGSVAEHLDVAIDAAMGRKS